MNPDESGTFAYRCELSTNSGHGMGLAAEVLADWYEKKDSRRCCRRRHGRINLVSKLVMEVNLKKIIVDNIRLVDIM